MKPVGDHLATAVALLPAPTPSAPSGKAPSRAPDSQAAVVTVSAHAEPVAPPKVKLATPAEDVRFVLDDESGEPVAVVVDAMSGDVIRQIPSEEMLALRRQLGRLQGVMLQETA